MRKKTLPNFAIRRAPKTDFSFFNFPVLTSGILKMYQENPRKSVTVIAKKKTR